ncbi:MAG: SulP family inorganic anion transporter [Cyclobacteriaceae bacterium]
MFKNNFKYDLPAGVVVFFVAIPLCLGVALASGAPLFSGIIAGFVGGIVVGIISNSSIGVSGPSPGLTVIVLSSIASLGTFEIFLVAVVLAGMFQIFFGFAKAGFVSHFFPTSVIKGMLVAIGLIIIFKQVPHAIGYDKDYLGDLAFQQNDGENTISELYKMLGAITPSAILVCVLSLIIIIYWEKSISRLHPILKFLPGPFVAVGVGILYQLSLSHFFSNLALQPEHLVSVPVSKTASEFFSQFTLPEFSVGLFRKDVWLAAAAISITASLESLMCVEATNKLIAGLKRTNTDQELIAQGAGNIVSGLLGGLPVSQAIVRSSSNIQAGGKTKAATITHGVMILLCVAIFPGILNLVPLASLAAILLVVGFRLVKPTEFVDVYRQGLKQFLPFIITVIGVVVTDLLSGIAMGAGVAILILLRSSLQNSYTSRIENHKGTWHVKIKLAQQIYFFSKGAIQKELSRVPVGSKVFIDGSNCINIDYEVLQVILDFKNSSEVKRITVELIGRLLSDSNVVQHENKEIHEEEPVSI